MAEKQLKNNLGEDIFPKLSNGYETVTDYSELHVRVELLKFLKKEYPSNINGYLVHIKLLGNFIKDREYKLINYQFPFISNGVITDNETTKLLGSYIANGYGFWFNPIETINEGVEYTCTPNYMLSFHI